MAFGLWNHTGDEFTPMGATACAVVAEWIPVQANYSWAEQSLSYEPTGSTSSYAKKGEARAIHLPSAWLQRLMKSYVSYASYDDTSIFSWMSPGNAVMIALGLADYGPVPNGNSAFVIKNWSWPRNCRCLGDECTSLDGNLPPKECNALHAYLNTTGMSDKYATIHLYSTSNWTDPTTLQYVTVKRYGSGYGYSIETIPVRLSVFILSTYILAMLSYLTYLLLTHQSGTSWNSIAELLMLALNSHQPQRLENTSVGVETLGTFKEPVSIRINAEDTAEIVFKNDLDVDQVRYRKVAVNTKY